MSTAHPLQEAILHGPVVLDGGLGTLLEAHGHDLAGGVWSARLLRAQPDAIVAAHREFFEAGAQVAIAASYQATFEGFAREGVGRREAEELLRRSVALANVARDGRPGWIAASVGPYGAMLADGSEYRGNYGLTVDELRAWHRPRLEILADSGADVLAAETLPSLAEVEAVTAEVDRLGFPAWISVTVSLGTLRSGESLAEAFSVASSSSAVLAVGVNCSAPSEVLGAIAVAREVTDKPVVVYPNSGEEWDAKNRTWVGSPGFPDELVRRWRRAGATLIGGCCRVRPAQIAHLAEVLEEAA